MNEQQIKENAADFRAISLPYVLQRQEDGSYLVLDRKYKPIGFLTDEWVHYEKYPIAHHFVGRPLRSSQFLEADMETSICMTMTAYLEKLAILMKQDVY